MASARESAACFSPDASCLGFHGVLANTGFPRALATLQLVQRRCSPHVVDETVMPMESEYAGTISCALAVSPGCDCSSSGHLQVHRRPGGGGLCPAPALGSSLCAVRCRRAFRVAPCPCSWLLQPPRRPPFPLQQPRQPEQRSPADSILGGAARGSGGHEQPGQRWREGLGRTHRLSGTPTDEHATRAGARGSGAAPAAVAAAAGRQRAGGAGRGGLRGLQAPAGEVACKEVEQIWLEWVPWALLSRVPRGTRCLMAPSGELHLPLRPSLAGPVALCSSTRARPCEISPLHS